MTRTIALILLLTSAYSVSAAVNEVTFCEWRNVSGFPGKNKVLYSGHVTKDAGAGNSFNTSVGAYWVDSAGTPTWDSYVIGSIPAGDANRLNYGLAYTVGFKSNTSDWRFRTKAIVVTPSGNVDVWSPITTPG